MIGEWFEKGGGVVQRDVYTKYFRYTAKRADIQSIAIYRSYTQSGAKGFKEEMLL
jgi:hypothetical protein